MEQFEFLPIKCRTERARLLYHRNKEAADNKQVKAVEEGKPPLKSKVGMYKMFDNHALA